MYVQEKITKTIIMITYKRYFARYCSLYEYGLSVFDSLWFPYFLLYFPPYPFHLVEH